MTKCYHCGDDCNTTAIVFDDKDFCCNGCKTVYEIFQSNDLTYYYDLQSGPGTTPLAIEGKYDFLNSKTIAQRLIEFDNGTIQIINLYIPGIHCSSCIWVLENLKKLHPGVTNSQVDFPKKTIRITYNSELISLKELVILLARIGYEPYISLEDY
ncbi:MAG: heavy metal translocating P-type ATPase metal-binding domain-containing protein, partial [Eudoraea sp.]